MSDDARRRAIGARSILDFLTVVGLALLVPSCGGAQAPTCANVGCGPPPMCGTGCQATCGCCTCAPGTRQGDLICTDQGCFAQAPPSDGGVDGGWTPPAICALPFDVGPCDAAISVYASVGGTCVPRVYGGCQGNDNRFTTLEECLATCEGRPVPNGCPDDRVARSICLACGPAGGCAKQETVCALGCGADAGVCTWPVFACYSGACQATFCE